jgi:transposase
VNSGNNNTKEKIRGVIIVKKYIVKLSSAERCELEKTVRSQSKKISAEVKTHAKILVLLDENGENPISVSETAKKVKQNMNSIYRSVKKYATDGTEAMVYRSERTNISPLLKVTGEVEAHIIATACSEVPEGRINWTMQMIADKIVSDGVTESISDETVRRTLKKTNYSLTNRKCGAYLRSKMQTLQPKRKTYLIYMQNRMTKKILLCVLMKNRNSSLVKRENPYQ